MTNEAGKPAEITLRKTVGAYKGFGDRAHAVTQGGRYDVIADGEIVANVRDTGGGAAFAAASWAIEVDGRDVASHFATRAKAIAEIAKRLERYGAVILPESAIVRGRRAAK